MEDNTVPTQGSNEPAPEKAPDVRQVPEQKITEAPADAAKQESKADPVAETLQNITKPAPNQPKVTGDEKLWGFISYLPLIGPILALILRPESDYIKLHGRQGLLVFIFFFFNIFIYLFPYIGPFLGIIVHFGLIVLALYSMYQALIGNWWKIPVFGDIAEMIPTDLFVKVTREAVMGPEKIEKDKASVDAEVSAEQSASEPQEKVEPAVAEAAVPVEPVPPVQPVPPTEQKQEEVQLEPPKEAPVETQEQKPEEQADNTQQQ